MIHLQISLCGSVVADVKRMEEVCDFKVLNSHTTNPSHTRPLGVKNPRYDYMYCIIV